MHPADHFSKDLYSSYAILKSTHFESHPAKHTFIVSNFYQNSLGSSKLNCQPLFILSAGQFLLTAPKTLLSALTLISCAILNIFTSSQNHCFQTFRNTFIKSFHKYMRLGPPHHHTFSFQFCQLISCLASTLTRLNRNIYFENQFQLVQTYSFKLKIRLLEY